MSLNNYQLVIGHARQLAPDDEERPHLEILLDVNGKSCRVIVNARSAQGHDPLLYHYKDPWRHPITSGLKHLLPGIHDLRFHRTDLAVDYIRSGVLDRQDMQVASSRHGEMDNDLRGRLWPLLQQAIRDQTILVYAFGEVLGQAPVGRDRSFHFEADSCLHDLHMNQGSAGCFRPANGPLQDGALMLYFSREKRWSAFFLAFKSQVWMTDSQSGAPLVPPSSYSQTKGG